MTSLTVISGSPLRSRLRTVLLWRSCITRVCVRLKRSLAKVRFVPRRMLKLAPAQCRWLRCSSCAMTLLPPLCVRSVLDTMVWRFTAPMGMSCVSSSVLKRIREPTSTEVRWRIVNAYCWKSLHVCEPNAVHAFFWACGSRQKGLACSLMRH